MRRTLLSTTNIAKQTSSKQQHHHHHLLRRRRRTISSATRSFSTAHNNKNNNSNEPFYGSPRNLNNSAPLLTTLQKLTLTAYSATSAFIDPERHEMVAALSEVTGHVALQNLLQQMKQDENGMGQRILTERPVVSKATIDIQKLKSMEGNTFGYAYATFLESHNFDPDLRAKVQYIQNEELEYVMLRYRQCHDFYHVITDLPPTIPGELALKYVELFQTGLPVCALSATVGSWKLKDEEERNLWRELYLPWSIQVGKEGTRWMNIYWEELFDRDIDELRKELNIVTAPSHST